MRRYEKEAVRLAASCIDVLRDAGVKLHPADARAYLACCVAHAEKSPSMRVFVDGRGVHCFGCGWRADVFGLYTQIHGGDFAGALQALGDRYGAAEAATGYRRPSPAPVAPVAPALPDVRPLTLEEAAPRRTLWAALQSAPVTADLRTWCDGRGLDSAAAHAFGVRGVQALPAALRAVEEAHGPDAVAALGLATRARSWADSAGVLMPCNAGDDAPTDYRLRYLQPFKTPDGRLVKAMASRGIDPALRAPIASPTGWRFGVPLVICEGEPDALSVAQLVRDRGLSAHVIGLTGASWQAHWWPLLQDASRVIVAVHSDRGTAPASYGPIGDACRQVRTRAHAVAVEGDADLNDQLRAGGLSNNNNRALRAIVERIQND